jgi:hypothetical protein
MRAIPKRTARVAGGLAGIHAFALVEGPPIRAADTEALRRAVMARAEAPRRGADAAEAITGDVLRAAAGRGLPPPSRSSRSRKVRAAA